MKAFSALVCAVAVAVSLAACGGSTSSAGGGGDTANPQEGIAEATSRLAAGYKGNQALPPTKAPTPAAGKNVWIISCGQNSESCARPSAAAAEAAEELGWKATVFDAKFDPSTAGEGVRQAIAAGADGIVSVGWDCPVIRGPLQQAKAAGIQVVPSIALDCTEPAFGKGGSSLMTNVRLIKQYPTLTEYLRAWGRVRADWAIAETEGKAKVILFALKDLVEAQQIAIGFREELEICDECEIVDEPSFQGTDTGAGLQQIAGQSLVAHPDANVVIVDYNSTLTGGVLAAIQQSGRSGELLVGGGEGMSTDFQLLDEGKIDAIFFANQSWNGYAAIDTLNRLFDGESPKQAQVPEGNGFTVITEEHDMPTEIPDSATAELPDLGTPWKQTYEKAWGLR
jgi:ribose transport system substrate-binding protein